jgi:hypothetical protein
MTTINQEALNALAEGIVTRNVERVKAALADGGSPAAPIQLGIGGPAVSPLEALMTITYDSLRRQGRTSFSKEEFEARTAEIARALIQFGAPLAAKIGFTNETVYLADQVAISSSTEAAAEIILNTLQKDAAYDPYKNIDLTLAKLASGLLKQMPIGQEDMALIERKLDESIERFSQTMKTVFEKAELTGSVSIPAPMPFDMLRALADQVKEGVHAQVKTELGMSQQKASLPPELAAAMGAANGGMMMLPSAPSKLIQTLQKQLPESTIAALKDMPGTAEIQADAQRLVARSNREAMQKLRSDIAPRSDAPPRMLNTVFEGSESVDMGALARNRAELLHSLGLTGNRYAEIDAENLASLFEDGSARRVTEIFKQADVLFIDRVYSIASRGPMGAMVIDALTDALKSRPRELTVILSGAEKEMQKFFAENPVLEERFRLHRMKVAKPSADDLGRMLDREAAAAGLAFEDSARKLTIEKLASGKGQSLTAIWALLDEVQDKPSGDPAVVTAQEVVSAKALVPSPEKPRIGFNYEENQRRAGKL